MTNAKPFFRESETNLYTLFENFSLYLNFQQTCVQVCQKPKLNLLSLGIMVEGFKISNLFDEYKTIFLGKRGKRWNSWKTYSIYLNFLKICFWVCQKSILNLLGLGIMVQGLKMPNLSDKYKIIFLGKWEKRWNSWKTFSVYFNFL